MLAAFGTAGLAIAFVLRPMILWVALLALLVAIPYYAVPNVGGEPFVPSALVAWILGIRLLIERGRVVKLAVPDVVVLSLLVAMSVSVAAHVRSHGDLYREVFLWIGPYLGARYAWAKNAGTASRILVLSAAALLPFVAVERLTGANPFRHFAYNQLATEVWAPALDRFNGVRPEASFGHPIALSMFLAFSAVVALGLSVAEVRKGRRRLWLAIAISLGAGQAVTLSRTGWVVIGIGLLGLLPSSNGLMRRPSTAISVTLAVLVLLIAPQGHTVRRLLASPFTGTASSELIDSTDHRTQQLHQVEHGGVIRSLGNTQPQLLGSVDSEYLLLGDRWGFLSMLAFALLIPGVALRLLRRTLDPVDRATIAGASGLLLGLLFVALITQQQVAVWMALGMAASASTRAPRAFV